MIWQFSQKIFRIRPWGFPSLRTRGRSSRGRVQNPNVEDPTILIDLDVHAMFSVVLLQVACGTCSFQTQLRSLVTECQQSSGHGHNAHSIKDASELIVMRLSGHEGRGTSRNLLREEQDERRVSPTGELSWSEQKLWDLLHQLSVVFATKMEEKILGGLQCQTSLAHRADEFPERRSLANPSDGTASPHPN